MQNTDMDGIFSKARGMLENLNMRNIGYQRAGLAAGDGGQFSSLPLLRD